MKLYVLFPTPYHCIKLHLHGIKGTQIGPLLVLVCPCFRENVIVTCKIMLFLCSLDNFLLKNVIVFGNQISKWHLFKLLVTFFSITREKTQKFLQHISHLHTYTYFAHPIDYFLPYQFYKNYEFIMYCFSLVWLLVLILFHSILEQPINNKMVSKIRLECLLLMTSIYTNAKVIVICKPRTLNDCRWRLSSIQKTQKKYCFLVATILFFIGKIIIT